MIKEKKRRVTRIVYRSIFKLLIRKTLGKPRSKSNYRRGSKEIGANSGNYIGSVQDSILDDSLLNALYDIRIAQIITTTIRT